jgi:SulP family sulfate permease
LNTIFKPKLYVVLKQGYTWSLFRKDLNAGIMVGIITIPLIIAFTVAAGISPEKGFITAIIGGLLVSVLGGGRFQISGPTAAFIVIIFGIAQRYGFDGLMISTMLAGIILIVFGLLRLGSVIKLIPLPLVVGFTSGIAVIAISMVVRDIVGFPGKNPTNSFIQMWVGYFSGNNQVNFYTLIISLLTILISIYGSKKIRKLPGYVFALVIVTLVVYFLNIPVQTIQSAYGNISGSVDFQLPHLDLYRVDEYITPAFTIALLCSVKSLLSSVVADGMTSSNHRSNTELIAQGTANLIVPFFAGIPVSGAVFRTISNIKNGARTPFSGIIHSLVLLLFLFVGIKWIGYVPLPCLAGIIVVFAWHLADWRSFVAILKGSKYDVIVLITTFSLTVLANLTIAIEVGMVLAALLFMQRISKMSNIESVDIDTDIFENYSNLPKGVDVYEISGPFFFGAAQSYKEALKEISGDANVLILRMRYVPFIDSTGIHIFREVIRDFRIKKVRIILSGVRPEVRQELIGYGLTEIIGNEYICDNFSEAVKKATKESDRLRFRNNQDF